MFRFLFQRLTPDDKRGAILFEAVVAEARRPHWYVEGGIADTLDGRFAVLATIAALATVRLERGDEASRATAVALAERFVEAMDAEHRQLGLGDPALGKHVRRLLSSLGRRVELWRAAVAGETGWSEAVRASLHAESDVDAAALEHCAARLAELWNGLRDQPHAALAEGRIG